MPYQVRALKLAFQPTDPDSPNVPTGPEEIVERGGLVPDYAPGFLVAALVNAGQIMAVAEPDPALRPPAEEPAPSLLNPEQPPPPGGSQTLPPEPLTKPKVTDSKADWEAYAASPAVGMDRGEVESMTKPKLISEVNRIEAERGEADKPVE